MISACPASPVVTCFRRGTGARGNGVLAEIQAAGEPREAQFRTRLQSPDAEAGTL